MSKLTLKGMTSLVPMPSNDMLIRQAQLELCDWKAKLRRNSKDIEALCYAGEVADTLGRAIYSRVATNLMISIQNKMMNPPASLMEQSGVRIKVSRLPQDNYAVPVVHEDFLNMAAEYYMRAYKAAPDNCYDPIFGRILYNMASLVQDGFWDNLGRPIVPQIPVQDPERGLIMMVPASPDQVEMNASQEKPRLPKSQDIAFDVLRKMEVEYPDDQKPTSLVFSEILSTFYGRSGNCWFFPSILKMAEMSFFNPDLRNMDAAMSWSRFGESVLQDPRPGLCVEEPFKCSFLSLMQSIADPQNGNLMLKVQTEAICSRPLTFNFLSVAEDLNAYRV